MRRALFLPFLVLLLGLAACSSDDTLGAIDVTATNDTCDVAKTDLSAGKSTFAVKNDGDDVTEVYVYAKGDEVKGEVENIGPGTSRNLTVDLAAGEYEVACKPGMKGDGIRTTVSVTGTGGTATAKPTKSVTIEAMDYSYGGLADMTFTKGETVELRLHNEAPEEKHELEIFGPDAGTYRVNCGIEDHADMGMKGTFTVT